MEAVIFYAPSSHSCDLFSVLFFGIFFFCSRDFLTVAFSLLFCLQCSAHHFIKQLAITIRIHWIPAYNTSLTVSLSSFSFLPATIPCFFSVYAFFCLIAVFSPFIGWFAFSRLRWFNFIWTSFSNCSC